MSHFFRILISPFEMFFGENGVFASDNRNREKRKTMLLGLPAVIIALLGCVLLFVGELRAGKELREAYSERVETARDERTKIRQDLSREARMRGTSSTLPGTPQEEIIDEDDPRLAKTKELIADEETYLKKLNSLAPDEPEHLFNLARLCLQKGDIDRGLAIMNRLAPQDSAGYAEAHLFLAQSYINQKVSSDRDKGRMLSIANIHIDHALLRDENDVDAIRMKAQLMLQVRNLEEAQKYFDKLLKFDPRVYGTLCQINNNLNAPKDVNLAVLHSARARFQEQLTTMPPSVDRLQVATLLADCLQRLGDFEMTRSKVADELALVADKPQLAAELGVERWANRILADVKFKEAVEDGDLTEENWRQQTALLEEGFELDPSNLKILQVLSKFQGSKIPGVREKVISIYDARDRLDAPAPVDNQLGIVALSEERFADAISLFGRAVQKARRNPEYLNNLAYTRMKLADFNLAKAEVKKKEAKEVADRDPTEANEEALNIALARALTAREAQISAAAKAEKDIDLAIRNIKPGSQAAQHASNFYDTKGNALIKQGKYNQAVAEFLRASVSRPDNIDIVESILTCYEKDGQTDRAEVWRAKYEELKARRPAE